MKKLFLVLLILAVIAGSAFAFDPLKYPPPVKGGNVMVDAGLGLRSNDWGGKFGIPPLFVNVEYALPGIPLSLGGGISFFTWKWEFLGYDMATLTYITPYARANWHWGFPVDWMDLYTGLSLGYDIVSLKWNDSTYKGYSAAGSEFYFAFQVGAHFYFTKNIGAVVETGYPYLLKGGVAFKF